MRTLTHAGFCDTDHKLAPTDPLDGEQPTDCYSPLIAADQVMAWLTATDHGTEVVVLGEAAGTRMTREQFAAFCRAGLELVAPTNLTRSE